MPGTVTTTRSTIGPLRKIRLAFTADAAAATIPETALPAFEGAIYAVEFNPGATAPTDNYDFQLLDGEGADRLAAAAMNRDTATTERVTFGDMTSGTGLARPVVDASETLTATWTNNAVNSAVGTVDIWYGPIA